MADRRAFVDALREIPAKHRAWLEQPDRFDLFCFYGWGVMPNDAQLAAADAVFRGYPPGTIHVWRWANRTGKTTGLDLIMLSAIWQKWRYVNEDFDTYLGYTYRVLHSAPLNKLMGKAWGIVDALIAGTAEQQLSPLTNRPREAILRPFFRAGRGTAVDGSDELWTKCANGGIIDFLSTHDGAGRMESEKWWLIDWDEFPQQQPVDDVPLLVDSKFLPRSSDHMAPVILSGTATEDSEPVYSLIEEMAESSPLDWNFTSYARSVNFSQSQESIDRQIRLSFDKETAGRSVYGLSGQAGYGLLPQFAVDNCFTADLPERSDRRDGYRYFGSFDHAVRGDENVATTWGCPWPPTREVILKQPIIGVAEAILRSSRNLTIHEHVRLVEEEYAKYGHVAWVVDATAEGGLLVYNELRRAGIPVIKMSYNEKKSASLPPNKDLALQRLQRLLVHGLEGIDIDPDTGWVRSWPTPTGTFGGLRLPASWRRTRAQMTTYKRFDAKLRQDRVMTEAMLAWQVYPLYDGGARPKARPFNVMARRRRVTGGISRWAQGSVSQG